MQDLISRELVLAEVKKAIAETLEIEETAIEIESVLTRDLGAESLDFLDINYRLEQAFGIRMARYSVLEHAEDLFGEGWAIDENGRLTGNAISLLSFRLGDDVKELKAGMDMDELPAFIRVGSFVDAVVGILESLPASCPACSRQGWKVFDRIKIRCDSCGANAALMAGDDLIKKRLQENPPAQGVRNKPGQL